MRRPRNVFVTGIPRAGTTLACALIDGLDDAVCLSEPQWQADWPLHTSDADAYVARLRSDFARVRQALLRGEAVTDRRDANGAVVSDYFPPDTRGSAAPAPAPIAFRRAGLSADFLLGMKHNAHYTCVLEQLVEQPDFVVLAIVRDPVATLLSWQSLDLPVSRGELPAARRLWPEIAAIERSSEPLLVRQARIYEAFCARYLALRDKLLLCRYRDMVADPGLPGRLLGRSARWCPAMRSAAAPRGDARERARIWACLRDHCPTALQLYPQGQ